MTITILYLIVCCIILEERTNINILIMKKLVFIFASLSVFAVLFSCSKNNQETESLEDNPRIKLSLSEQQKSFANSGNAFAFELFDKVSSSTDKSIVISPISMQYLLGMALNGAQGETAEQICKVLGFGAGQTDAVNQYVQSLLKQLPSLDKKTTLAFANAVYASNDEPILETYQKIVKDYYQAEVSKVNFSDKATLSKINSWCSKHTKGLVPEILNNLSGDEKAVLLNAMCFMSTWSNPFDKSRTTERIFSLEDGGTVKIPMMAKLLTLPYFENEDFSMVGLDYGNNAFSFLAILPSAGKSIADVTGFLKSGDLRSIFKTWRDFRVDLWLPRFETKFDIELNYVLSEMGMPDCFNPLKANFKSMFKTPSCFSLIKQSSAIKVDEKGTEAATVSVGKMGYTASHSLQNAVFHADRPFVYLIVENSTRTVLFAGKYTGK